MSAQIMALEQAVDALLPAAWNDGLPRAELSAKLRLWFDAVWDHAALAGAAPLAGAEVERALRLARRPVFICGAHRSGTTLVRNLLDGHPELTVLPVEGNYFASLEPQLQRMPREQYVRFAGGIWLRRLAHSVRQPPYWLLGRTTADRSPYEGFARALMAWWAVLEHRIGAEVSVWPLIAVTLAWSTCGNEYRVDPALVRWVEKTPGSEPFLDRMRAGLPDAKVLHIVRDPVAVLASRKELEARIRPLVSRRVLLELDRSYRIAEEQSDRAAAGTYMIVRYEELCASPRIAVERIAEFLSIEMHPTLLEPTVAGMPARANTSFADRSMMDGILRPGAEAAEGFTPWQRAALAAHVRDSAVRLGYRVPPAPAWRVRLLRVARKLVREA